MINTSIIFFLGLCPIIPLTVHFADGLIFAAEFWLLFGTGLLSDMAIQYFNIKKFPQTIRYLSIMSAAALYVQIVGALFPVLTVSYESYFYLFAFSYILIICVATYKQSRTPLVLPVSYSLLLSAVSLFRELLVFGTVSLPMPAGLFSIQVFPTALPLAFWGSSAGILMLLGIGVWLFYIIQKGTSQPVRLRSTFRNQP